MVELRDQLGTTWGTRLRAFGGLWLLLGGLFAALGLGALVLRATVVLLVVACVSAIVLGLGRGGAERRLRQLGAWIGQTSTRLRARLLSLGLPRRFERLAASGRTHGARASKAGLANAAVASRHARIAAARGGRSSAVTLRALGAKGRSSSAVAFRALSVKGGAALRAGAESVSRLSAQAAAPPNRLDRAMRLNTVGAQLRREGAHARAVEQHRAALAIVRSLGDRHTEALTLNNLALAVVHTEGIAAAERHFEEALTVLRALGDDEHEGRVIANLAFVHKSHGHSEEAEGLLHAALDKLPADSTAYRRVEEQLRRAS